MERDALERFWSLLLADRLPELLAPGCAWDDPIFDAAAGSDVRETAVPRFARWIRERASGDPARHFRTTADDRRVVVEAMLGVKDGLVWDPVGSRAVKSPRIDLAVAVVGERADRADLFSSLHVYFGTWPVLDGEPRTRVGPICADERAKTKAAMDAMPVVRDYFDRLARGAPGMADLFEADGYFREPSNNFVCGWDQLRTHFEHVLAIGGVGIEFLTAVREGERIGFELQTIQWGPKRMPKPQAGFAIYELGPHGLLQGARVYDSVVPP